MKYSKYLPFVGRVLLDPRRGRKVPHSWHPIEASYAKKIVDLHKYLISRPSRPLFRIKVLNAQAT
jgi:hypothetical protein